MIRRLIFGCFVSLSLWMPLMVSSVLAQSYLPPEQVAKEFQTLLERPRTTAKSHTQIIKTDSLWIEKGYFFSEIDEKVPLLIYKPVTNARKLPVVICLYGTGGSMVSPDMKNMLYRFAKLGFMAVCIDARFHGERGGARGASTPGSANYVRAITSAWENKNAGKQTHPFFYDTVYDLWRLTDYLVSRKDVDAARVGMMGISMGGIETWMAASVDQRIKVAVPIIAAQSFKWSLENDRWQGRVGTIRAAHEAAAKQMGDKEINQRNIKVVWNKLLPGILDKYDCPSMIRLFAPRPLLLLNNGDDQNCPLPGAEIAFEAARNAYKAKAATNKLKIHVTPGEPHRLLPTHMDMACEWFLKWL